MNRKVSPALENAVAPGVRASHIEPLATRIARNRLKFVGFMLAFTLFISSAVAIAVGVLASIFTFMAIYSRFGATWTDISQPAALVGKVTLAAFAFALAVTAALAAVRLTRAEHLIVERLGAHVPHPDEFQPTRRVLHDVALAAGMRVTPTLYVIDTRRVNAFVVGRSPDRVRVGVTTGMIDRIPPGEQRAVFANLIARVLSLDTLWATASSAMMGPIWSARDGGLRRAAQADIDEAEHREEHRQELEKAGWYVPASTVIPAFLVLCAAVVVTEVLSWYHREATWQAAEKADAEGMMLLKDPASMLSAMEHVLDRDNFVPTAGDAYSPLFYCWAGYGFAPEDDPEMRRVARLRETLGAEGAAYLPRPNVPLWTNPPLPPRLELLRKIESGHVSGGDDRPAAS